METVRNAAAFRRRIAAMRGSGSSARTENPRRANASVALPVPAPISRIRPTGGMPLQDTTSSRSASGYEGRAAS